MNETSTSSSVHIVCMYVYVCVCYVLISFEYILRSEIVEWQGRCVKLYEKLPDRFLNKLYYYILAPKICRLKTSMSLLTNLVFHIFFLNPNLKMQDSLYSSSSYCPKFTLKLWQVKLLFFIKVMSSSQFHRIERVCFRNRGFL